MGAIAVVASLFLAGCSAQEVSAPIPEPVEEVTTDLPGEPIVVWGDAIEIQAIEDIALQFEADTGVAVSLVDQSANGVRESFLATAEADAPDVIFGTHLWPAELASLGLIAPIEIGSRADGFIVGSVDAFKFEGQQFGLPYSQENVALVCSTAAMPAAPETFQEAVDSGLAISLNEGAGDPYHLYAIQSSFGATVFELNENGEYTSELGMSGESGFAFAEWLSKNASSFDLSSSTSDIREQLISGEKSCWITGPWNVPWLNESLGEGGWAAYPIPSAGSQPAAPFADVRGVMLGTNAKNAAAAKKFILEYIGSETGQFSIFESSGRAPAHLTALENAAAESSQASFGLAGLSARPMPTSSAMNFVWTPWGAAQMAIIRGDGDPQGLWQAMINEISAAIDG